MAVIRVRVVPNAKKECIVPGDPFVVKVSAPPRGGKANERLIELLAKHFGTKKGKIKIIRGHTSREKVIEITEP